MSEEKQIEEMAKAICPNIYGHYGCDSCDLYDNECCLPFNIARSLTEKGYRKQSEGKWGFKGTAYGCSLCGHGAIAPIYNYCPNCGAKMKERIEHEQERNAPGE